MGGLCGHINSLTDNPNLTFGEIKNILYEISNGKLGCTEKLDGINLYLSFSNARNETRIARNKGNIRSGGISINDIKNHFPNKKSLINSIHEAIQSWEMLIENLNPFYRQKVFGEDADVYYNVEVVDPDLSNVIKYDNRNLILHQTGHAYFDRKTGSAVKNIDIKEGFNLLKSFIDKSNDIRENNNFAIKNNAFLEIKPSSLYKEAVLKIENLQNKLKIKNNQTISEYTSLRIKDFLKREFPGLTISQRNNIVNKINGIKGLKINKILEEIAEEPTKEKIRALIDNSSIIYKESIHPLENIIHDFAISFLKEIKSNFINDAFDETNRMKEEFNNSIKTIRQSEYEEAIKILDKNLQKIKNEHIVSLEGIVFEYSDKPYKLTGNFAPLNQILGLMKYGRGSMPPLNGIVKESDKNRIVGIIPGAFKPPHVGHYLGAKHLANIPNINEVIVLISNKSRFINEREFTTEQSKKIWEIWTKNDPKIKISVSNSASPIKEIYDTIINMNPGDTLLLGLGEKDVEDNRYDRMQEWSNKNGYGVKVERVITNVGEHTHVSSTLVRELALTGNKDKLYNFMPQHLSGQEKEETWNIINNMKNDNINEHIVKQGDQYCLKSKKTNKNLGCYPTKDGAEKREKQVQYFKHINELSAAGGGAIEGSVLNKKKINKNFIELEGLFIDRNKLIAEIKLRETIQKFIKETLLERGEAKNLLINKIKQIISEEKSSEVPDTTNASTGINVLEDLLKKIIPQLEKDYKILTSNEDQRKSFKAHILNAISKGLTVVDLNKTAAEVNENISLDVGDEETEDKFIDIEDKPKDKEADKLQQFTIPGQNETGRNMAIAAYDKIEKNILDAYSILSDNEDKQLFYDYLLANLKLYFSRFENDMSTQVSEPIAGDDIASGV